MSYFPTRGNLTILTPSTSPPPVQCQAPRRGPDQPSTSSVAQGMETEPFIHYEEDIRTSPPKKPEVPQRELMSPGSLIFKYLQCRCPVMIWLYANLGMQIGGLIVGFDEYMNIVLEKAFEWHKKTGKRKYIGNIVLKANTITLIRKEDPNRILPTLK